MIKPALLKVHHGTLVCLVRLSTLWFSNLLRLRMWLVGASVGGGLVATGPVILRVHPLGRLAIGDNCRFNSGSSVNLVGGYRRMVIWVGRGGCLNIGNRVGLSNCTLVALLSIEIGDDVMIGGDATLVDSDFHSLEATSRLQRPDLGVQHRRVRIGAKAFIGMGSTILKGSQIGSEAVVGAGAVVTRDVPDGEIWAGNPASKIRRVPVPQRPSSRV